MAGIATTSRLHPFHAWKYDEDFIPKEVVRLGLVEPGQDNPLIRITIQNR